MKDYDLKANSYDWLYLEEQMSKYEFAEKRTELGIESKVLDLGCGTGLFSERIVDKVELIVGIDLSIGMLLKAKSKFSKKSNIHFINSDMDHLPLRENIFNRAFIFTVLERSSGISNVIGELNRVLTVDSTVIVSILKKNISQIDFESIISKMNLKHRPSVEDTDAKDFLITLELK